MQSTDQTFSQLHIHANTDALHASNPMVRLTAKQQWLAAVTVMLLLYCQTSIHTVTSLCNDFFGSREDCPDVKSCQLRGASAVRIQ